MKKSKMKDMASLKDNFEKHWISFTTKPDDLIWSNLKSFIKSHVHSKERVIFLWKQMICEILTIKQPLQIYLFLMKVLQSEEIVCEAVDTRPNHLPPIFLLPHQVEDPWMNVNIFYKAFCIVNHIFHLTDFKIICCTIVVKCKFSQYSFGSKLTWLSDNSAKKW